MRTRNGFIAVIAMFLAALICWWPLLSGFADLRIGTAVLGMESVSRIILRTVFWATGVAVIATLIGWPLGRLANSCSGRMKRVLLALLVGSLAIPAYAVFYAWWSLWPANSPLFDLLARYDAVPLARYATLAISLVAWCWPIPAVVAAMWHGGGGTSLLHSIDGPGRGRAAWNVIVADRWGIIATILLVSAIVSTNTASFDLAQVATIATEFRMQGMSPHSLWQLTLCGAAAAAITAAMGVVFVRRNSRPPAIKTPAHSWRFIAVWFVLTGGPILLAAILTLRGSGEMFQLYGGDLVVSVALAAGVAIACLPIMIASMLMHASDRAWMRTLAWLCMFSYLLMAMLPAAVVGWMLGESWNRSLVDVVYRSNAILVLAHLSKVAFIAAIAGYWIASGREQQILLCIDAPRTIRNICAALRPRLLQGGLVVMAVAIAVSMGEAALTRSVAPPAQTQPIGVALLSAMHYQRPEVVTSALAVIVACAMIAGAIAGSVRVRGATAMLLFLLVVACERQPAMDALPVERVIGASGSVNGRFVTPRAVDAQDGVVVVIDKSGRVQRLDSDGEHLTTWKLPSISNGYPTGVSIGGRGWTWVPDTHGHRVLVFDTNGKEVFRFGSYGTDDGQFIYPTDIAFLDDEVFVSEYGGNDRVSAFDRTGTFLRSFGTHGQGKNAFQRPQSIAPDPASGCLYIADSGNHRIVVTDGAGEVLRIIGSAGRGEGKLLYPYGVCLLEDGSLLVCEYGNNRLQQFTPDGRPLQSLGGAGSIPGQLRTPWAIAADGNEVVVADTGNDRLQVLRPIMAGEW
ncbi:MAG: hypothetical protein QGH76_03810 [Phycisphaerales bacterium]|nr:hypothetical protein [Phycisphaerales bacterium]